jgi:hypothetical protein
LSDALIEKETLDLKTIKSILGDRPFGMPKEIQEILREELKDVTDKINPPEVKE